LSINPFDANVLATYQLYVHNTMPSS